MPHANKVIASGCFALQNRCKIDNYLEDPQVKSESKKSD